MSDATGSDATGSDSTGTPTSTPQAGRFPLLTPAGLSADQRAVYDSIAGPPRGNGPFTVAYDDGALAGPFNALLFAPAIGNAVQVLGAVLRFGGTLDGRLRELVICAVSAELDSAYEWYAHSRVAATVGIDEDELEHLRNGSMPPTLDAAERAALDFTGALLCGTTISENHHAAVFLHFGHAGVAELSLLVGYYRMLAGLLAAGNVPAPGTVPESDDTPRPETSTFDTTINKGRNP
ncbi:carboxymuconolactone decarboxylase family protein [Arthrobacter sp. Br18]|uniref:carboxymuconolactone decarboxylase family protein n=1 Tax=Arthrobacter sp. Br18 TaxID=1312954 RepID=UPI0020A65533|nr:carboxymuconolactone decarboxylase family protein [Arthrobacter sp. Br18]